MFKGDHTSKSSYTKVLHDGLGKRALAFEALALCAVPTVLVFCVLMELPYAAAASFVVVVLSLLFVASSVEHDRPRLRQLMPVVVLAACSAAGRMLFAPFADIKPVSAICIVAGATLGRRSGFATGAIAALVSNFYFGQGAWTPWQMYAWGMVGYLSGVLANSGLLAFRPIRLAWAFASAFVYGLVLNSFHVIGFVRPLALPTALAAFAAGLPLDVIHGLATCAFLMFIWRPWGKALERAVVRYEL